MRAEFNEYLPFYLKSSFFELLSESRTDLLDFAVSPRYIQSQMYHLCLAANCFIKGIYVHWQKIAPKDVNRDLLLHLLLA